jgi:hypothetical protein
MLGLFKRFTPQGRSGRVLMPFYDELKKNLEIYHVMDQRQFIDIEFKTDVWQNVRASEVLKPLQEVQVYGRSVEEFNQCYRSFKDYEKWYAADLSNKTKDNSQKLHAQRNGLDEKLKALYSIICRAGEQIEYKLIELGLIKQ